MIPLFDYRMVIDVDDTTGSESHHPALNPLFVGIHKNVVSATTTGDVERPSRTLTPDSSTQELTGRQTPGPQMSNAQVLGPQTLSGILSISRTVPTRAAMSARALPFKGICRQSSARGAKVRGSTTSK